MERGSPPPSPPASRVNCLVNTVHYIVSKLSVVRWSNNKVWGNSIILPKGVPPNRIWPWHNFGSQQTLLKLFVYDTKLEAVTFIFFHTWHQPNYSSRSFLAFEDLKSAAQFQFAHLTKCWKLMVKFEQKNMSG